MRSGQGFSNFYLSERNWSMPRDLKQTGLHSWHKEHGGQMIQFAGWEMPVAYGRGILEEHLSTRKFGGLFDISHMGRFLIRESMRFLLCSTF